ncbi:MAG: sulfatase-like hydrolase/transferase [Planctomycetes bacterium]|nr:sulfatase-like hydrolase/transferase [Planctomycetota bacterium]
MILHIRISLMTLFLLSLLASAGSSGIGRPNIIVIKTDDQRWDSLGIYGDKVVKTPHIDALAHEGTRFENVFTASPLCVPSRTSFFSGKYPTRTRRYNNSAENHISLGEFSFIEPLKKAGYTIGLSGKNHAFGKKYAKKWFDCFEEFSPWGRYGGNSTDKAIKKFRSTSGPKSRLGNMLLEGLIDFPEPFKEEECMTARIADEAIRFVEKNQKKPFFLHMSFPAPHWPNIVCEPYFSMYKDSLDEISLAAMDDIDWDTHPFAHYVQSQCTGFDTMSKKDRRKVLAVMYGQITFIDKSVGRLVAALKSLKLYENSVILFTSDQGCFGGQFGLPCKTKGYYESLIRVPFVIKMPGDKKLGRVTPAQVSNIDVMPTLLAYAGVKFQEEIDGQSFLSVLTEKKDSHRSTIYSEVGLPQMPPAPMSKSEYPAYNKKRSKEDMFWFIEYTTRGRSAMIRQNGWKYCYYNGDIEELYHYKNDPLELDNLATHPDHQDRKAKMKAELFKQKFEGVGE